MFVVQSRPISVDGLSEYITTTIRFFFLQTHAVMSCSYTVCRKKYIAGMMHLKMVDNDGNNYGGNDNYT